MPEDSGYYPGGGGDEPMQNQGSNMQQDEKPADNEAEGETALLPKSMFGGKEVNPGDEFVFKVVRLYSDEVEISYAKDEKGEGDMEGKPAMQESMNGMSKMASMGE